MAIWLMKSEPDAFSINDLKHRQRENWDGVRNFQARNYMREMAKGDIILFYHSSCKVPAIVGTAIVSKTAHPDPSCWDPKSPYYDPKSTAETPRWVQVELAFESKLTKPLTLTLLKSWPELDGFPLTKKGSRLSVMPVDEPYWHILKPHILSQS
ncbi:EVE domain-containing protein [Marinomonas atlantica]|uniref:EVE domain-containing protein n=1 Tax=Marinomonas atlantica TaxID=1806668 RepID=UPI00083497C3|nr:EVE domain-containing protein [Marinomonas atlantica]MCO4786646.1 EVE domain-containing protein [Marinomonas atlantica]